MSSSAITTQIAQLKAGNIQNQADSTSIYSSGQWSFKNSTAVASVTISDAGNVGIGTASPAVKMHVVGSASVYSRVESTASNDVAFNAKNSIYEAAFGVDNQGGYIVSGNNRPIYFYTSGLSRFIIQSNGTLISVPTYNNTSATAANMAVSSTGEFVRATSALKYKEDITPISFGLQTVLSMQPIEYKSKCEADKDASHKFIGFVADWEEANLPALVQKNGEGDVEGFSYDRLTAVLCKAIQEQQAQIEALRAEVAALKAP